MLGIVWGFGLVWFGLFSVDLIVLWYVSLHIFVECRFFWIVLGPHKMVDIPVAMQKGTKF